MPDITMCMGGKCPEKEKCWRHNAKPDQYWQSYFSEVPYEKYGSCDHFYPDRRFVRDGYKELQWRDGGE